MSPISKLLTDKRVQAFVDDTTQLTIVTSFLLFAVHHATLWNTQLWEKLLFCISGKLELHKSKICVFGWRFDSDGTASPDNTFNLTKSQILESTTQKPIEIGKIKMETAYKLLGVYVPFYGDMDEQLKYLLERSKQIKVSFTQLPLSPDGILLGIKTTVQPKLFYSMAATLLNDTSLNKVTQNLYYNLLPKTGFNRHFPVY
jgi:hypothetical protein